MVKKAIIGFAVFVGLLVLALGVLTAAQRRWPSFDPVNTIARVLSPDHTVREGEG